MSLKNITRGARNRARMGRNEAMNDMGDSREGFQDMISQAANIAGRIRDEGDQSVLERYGSDIQRVGDQVNDQAATASRGIQRGIMAGGGDITGGGAVALGNVASGANSAIRDAMGHYSQLNQQANQFEQNRGDRMMGMSMQGSQSLAGMDQNRYGMETQMLQQAEQQEIERKMANRQLMVDLFSSVIDTGAQFIPGGG